MSTRFMDCTEAHGKCIKRLRCYDSEQGVREIEIQFADGGMLALRVTSTTSMTGDFYENSSEGISPVRRYPSV